MISNPLDDPAFTDSLKAVGLVFVVGLGLVLLFARKDLRAGLTGELGRRYVGWMIIAPLFIAATFVGGFVGAAILLFVISLAAVEYVRVVGVQRSYALYLFGLIPATFAVAAFQPSLYFTLPAASLLVLTLFPILTGELENLYLQLSFAARGYLYVVWSLCHLVLLQDIGSGLVMLVGVGAAVADVMQYTVGKLIGRHVISPRVHAHKAWEGIIGAVLGASAAVALFDFALPDEFELPHKIALAFMIGIGAAWGDLVSSLVKRVAGAKDWGDTVPGHGGVLDRANSLVVVIPLVYYFTFLVLRYANGA